MLKLIRSRESAVKLQSAKRPTLTVDIRPHCRRTRTVHSYSSGGVNVHYDLVHGSDSTSQTAYQWMLQPFVYSQLTAECPYTLQWVAILALKIVPSLGDLDPRVILGPPDYTSLTASRSVQPFLQGLRSWQTDRQTDHATPVCNDRPHIFYIVLGCGLINKYIQN